MHTRRRKLDSLSKLKNALRINSQSNKISVPKIYFYGPTKLNAILTQLRCRVSFLNHDLCKVNILSSPALKLRRTSRRCEPLHFCL